MGSTYRFLALNGDMQLVYDWFSALPDEPQILYGSKSHLLYFGDADDPVATTPSGEVDWKRSPVADLVLPEKKRGVLWTAAELHFLSMPLAKLFPKLNAINRKFSAWLRSFDCVFSSGAAAGEWDYYLEGLLRNLGTPIYALPEAMVALRGGQYFVSGTDTEFVLDKLCRSLRLRGVRGLSTDA